MTDTAQLRAEGLSRNYGDLEALREVSLEVGRGEIVVVMGPSGSGKTTLLNLLALLDRPTRGKVYFEGEQVSGLTDRKAARIRNRRFGFIFQFFHLISELTVLENVLLPLWIREKSGMRMPEFRAEAERLLREFGLEDRKNTVPSRLSGGEIQRAAICRSLICNPAVIFADEPTGNIDRASAEVLFSTIRLLNRERGVTFLIATHNEKFLQLGTKIVYLSGGEVEKVERTAS